jgi:hypothetical protein
MLMPNKPIFIDVSLCTGYAWRKRWRIIIAAQFAA